MVFITLTPPATASKVCNAGAIASNSVIKLPVLALTTFKSQLQSLPEAIVIRSFKFNN
nr:MAG TPA: hypothetical protein [Caudoviricetes sp.]DAI70494.1 MAG TPA: hypothetical protein [Caudoviricetes sp.]DAV00693.1 MAG TPA: hypothetical protein [Caudoviricetes sp.]